MKLILFTTLFVSFAVNMLFGQYEFENNQLAEISKKMIYKLDNPKREETIQFSIAGENLFISATKKFSEIEYSWSENLIIPIKSIKSIELTNRKVNRDDFPTGLSSMSFQSLRNSKPFKLINSPGDTTFSGYEIISIPDDKDIESFLNVKNILDPILAHLVNDCLQIDTLELFVGNPMVGALNEYLEHKITMDDLNEESYIPILNKELEVVLGTEKVSSTKYQNLIVLFIVNEKDELVNLTTVFTDLFNNCDNLSEGCEFLPTVAEYRNMNIDDRKLMDDFLGLLSVDENNAVKNLIKSHKWKSGSCNGKKIATRMELTLNEGSLK